MINLKNGAICPSVSDNKKRQGVKTMIDIKTKELIEDMAKVIRQSTAEETKQIKQVLINNNIYLKCISYYLNNGIFLDVIEKLEPSNLEQIRTYLELCYLK